MQITVARVEHVGEEEVVAPTDGDHLAHDLRQLAPRHHGILEQIGRGDASHSAGGFLAPLPEQRALGLVARDGDDQRLALAADRGDALGLRLHLGARAVELDEQHRAGAVGIDLAHRGIHRADHRVVEHLERGGNDAGGDDRGDGLRGFNQARERRERRFHGLGRVEQPHGDRGDQAERPLVADDRPREVVTRAIGGLAADADHIARPRDDLEPEHVIRRDAVLETVRAARVGRDVAADRGDHLTGGIGREEPAAVAHGIRQPQIDEPGLHRGAAVGEVELEDLRHARHRDHDAALGRRRAADEAGARAARDDGHARFAAEPHDGLHLRGAGNRAIDRCRLPARQTDFNWFKLGLREH